MKMSAPEMVQRGHTYAIVDEVDSILIDEARTPLIISGPIEDRADLYMAVDELMKGVVTEADRIEKELKEKIEREHKGELEKVHGKEKAKELLNALVKEKLKELLKTQGLVELDEKQRQVSFTEAGNEYIENLLQEKGMLKGAGL